MNVRVGSLLVQKINTSVAPAQRVNGRVAMLSFAAAVAAGEPAFVMSMLLCEHSPSVVFRCTRSPSFPMKQPCRVGVWAHELHVWWLERVKHSDSCGCRSNHLSTTTGPALTPRR
jgi:hypothetical protein